MKRLLIANRGEIAVRIAYTARTQGVHTVGIHTDADAGSPHVAVVDQSVRIGAGPVGDSYLNADAVLRAARDSGADAVHPGYGFLSENGNFAQAVIDAGLIWVGPPPAAIRAMGNKAEAKRLMIAAGVPCVPGYEGADQSDAALMAQAATIGFPLMVKAAAGGGGRGMRLVSDKADLAEAITRARDEAKNAFGSGELILERAILNPRHVEVQVFADSFGTTVHLFERDCSVQRRHQKVLEEAPCPVLTAEERAAMGAAAVQAAAAIGYVGAGTVEFLRGEDGSFHFLEMNTRLQVEHPVTEMITGLVLVALQLDIARGQPLPFAQGDLAIDGHAIEARLYAEDTANGFLPATGRLALWQPPSGAGVRVDAGVVSGQDISPYYDPMLAKIIAHGPDRDTARRRLVAALERTAALGVATNRDFLIALLENDIFAAGKATTALIGDRYPGGFATTPTAADRAQAAQVWIGAARDRALARAPVAAELVGWASSGVAQVRVPFADGAHCVAPGTAPQVPHVLTRDALHVVLGARTLTFALELFGADVQDASPDRIVAPMAGALTALHVAPGDAVIAGQAVAVIEAMKMQHTLRATVAGAVAETPAACGAQVAAGALIVRLETGA